LKTIFTTAVFLHLLSLCRTCTPTRACNRSVSRAKLNLPSKSYRKSIAPRFLKSYRNSMTSARPQYCRNLIVEDSDFSGDGTRQRGGRCDVVVRAPIITDSRGPAGRLGLEVIETMSVPKSLGEYKGYG
jgi:hypothetical protein